MEPCSGGRIVCGGNGETCRNTGGGLDYALLLGVSLRLLLRPVTFNFALKEVKGWPVQLEWKT